MQFFILDGGISIARVRNYLVVKRLINTIYTATRFEGAGAQGRILRSVLTEFSFIKFMLPNIAHIGYKLNGDSHDVKEKKYLDA